MIYSSENISRDSPDTTGRWVAYNGWLSGQRLSDIKNPADTPIVYEAQRWPDGFVAVGFVDGHVKREAKAVLDQQNQSQSRFGS